METPKIAARVRTPILAGLTLIGLSLFAAPAFACAPPETVFGEPPPEGEVVAAPAPTQERFVRIDPNDDEDCAESRHAAVRLDQRLNSQASREHQIGLAGPRRYRLMAECGENCESMSFEVFDTTTGQSLGRSRDNGKEPDLVLDLPQSARVKVVATMGMCANEDGCRYGVGVVSLSGRNRR
jgi:hypothetical protein